MGSQASARKAAWDPDQYRRFSDARTRPARELIARIPARTFAGIVDLGCGDGPVTSLLAERFPSARIVGIDSSAAMLAAARDICPSVTFVEMNVEAWQPDRPVDMIFSNATLHWIDRHEILMPRLAGYLSDGGVIAVQMPGNFEAPSHRILADLVTSEGWRSHIGHLLRPAPVLSPTDYINLLSPRMSSVDAWETTDMLVLDRNNAVLEWMKGTALRPYLGALSASDAARFTDELATRLADAYPRRPDGTTIFPFRRIYFVAAR